MNWLYQTSQWYIALLTLGLLVLPLTQLLFKNFTFDRGYSFAKIIGVLLLSYLTFVGGILHLTPFNFYTLSGIALLLGVFNIWLIKKFFVQTRPTKAELAVYIFQEILFIICLFFWAFVRGQEASIHGLEKFMDYGYMKSILRSNFFPPLDMWLSADPQEPKGYFINYYYFGHLTGAVLIKLSRIPAEVGYNLILATLFALGVTQAFSFIANIIFTYFSKVKDGVLNTYHYIFGIFFGLLGAFILNLGGNLHTIYLFTSGYPNETPIPFWEILSRYTPEKYWYPNATRFIPYTIHEFPSYSYVVADLHGHVFDIPYVLLTLAILFSFFILFTQLKKEKIKHDNKNVVIPYVILFGFLCAIHYTTNAFDGLIYLLLISLCLAVIFRISLRFITYAATLGISFVLFSLPFTLHFDSFVSKIGVNCSPEFLTKINSFGPFLFEKGNCQSSAPWMLFILWGFFWISALLLLITLCLEQKNHKHHSSMNPIDVFMGLLFIFGTFLIIVPEFVYAKDIYPVHFRANTMFKLGYQAFMMMSIASTYTIFRIKMSHLSLGIKIVLKTIFIFFLFFVVIYPFLAVPSYYGRQGKEPELDGLKWMDTSFAESKTVVDYLNKNIEGQPVILEAQGDSYTDYNHISAYTGLPTVAGWWVHEWLWRGSSDVVGKRIPDIVNIYESDDYEQTKTLLKKYRVKYIIISSLEKQKYLKLNREKLLDMGKILFRSPKGEAEIIEVRD